MTKQTDLLVVAVLRAAHCETDVLSFKDLHRDQNALAIWNNKNTIRRRIYRIWPRKPDGKTMFPENIELGKCTSNNLQLWGSTILDFFWVLRRPPMHQFISMSTGSELSKWMIQHNQAEHASSELEWANNESDPRQIFPYPIAGVIEDQEMRIRLGICGNSMRASKSQDGDSGCDKEDGKGEESDMDVDRPINTIFSTDAYPAPWPLVPFSYEAPKIEQRLPLHMLPKKLVVHDPLGVLSNPGLWGSFKPRHDWTLTEDKMYVYKLSFGNQGKKRMQDEYKAHKDKKEQDRLERLKNIPDSDGCDGFLFSPIKLAAGPAEPPIFVTHAIIPDPEPVEEAHLYISPEQISGVGSHSLVLHAEWEVPRSLLVPDILCHECILEDVQKTLAVSDGEDGSRKDALWKEKSGLWEKVDKLEPEVTLNISSEYETSNMGTCVYNPGSGKTSFRYSGPMRIIKTNVQWQNAERGPYCSHVLKRMHLDERDGIADTLRPHPLTARVSLVAKLSTGDDHLNTEAVNYENFPELLFEHWTGYNIVAPLHEPTPVNAVIPQFYGYYVLENPIKGKYMSPILLMENCGKQICVHNMNMDDKHECAALVYRFNWAGYWHNSVYARNMLCQAGPLDRPMYQRGTGEFMEDRRKHAYRLIDFGRSVKEGDQVTETSYVNELLGLEPENWSADIGYVRSCLLEG